jgi:pimeloyl-ACP methyl ester carboxylesterase
VSGTATLAGTLAITTGAGFDPPLDSTYDVVTAGTVRGRFGSLTGSQLTGKRYQDEYGPAFARLRVVFAPIAPAPAEPIIFLPGFLGSRMVCAGSEAWPNPPLPQVLAMRLAPDGVSDLEGPCAVPEGRAGLIESAVTDVYGSTVEFLERIAPGRWHVFSYDWRKNPSESLQALDALVERVRGSGKVVLLGHSMGGLVTRSYIDDPDRARKVARAVTLGGVYWGAPKALFPLAAGVETPLDSALNVLIPRRQMQAFARDLQGLYFLWPSTPYGRWLRVDGRQPKPLDRPGLLRFVQFLGGNEQQLGRALDGHARHLDRFERNGVDYHVVIGTGLQTISRVRITPVAGETGSPGGGRPLEGIYRIAWANGDETVPRRSAGIGGTVPPDRLHIVCGISHLDLARDRAVTGRIGDFLRSGAPIAGTDDDCPAQGVEISIFRRLLGPASASAGPADAVTPEEAARAGRIELLDLGAQQLIAANASRPVTLRLDGRRLGLRVTPLGDDGQRGRPRFYGPLSGSLTIGAGADAEILKAGAVVQPRRRADRRPPTTRARVRLGRRHALVRLRARDDSGVAATTVRIGRRPATRVGGSLRVKRAALARLRFQSVDIFGNVERPRRVRIRRG